MLVKGKNFNVFVQDSGQWKLIYCSQSCSLSINTELLNTTSKGDGAFERFIARKINWTVSASGLIYFDKPYTAASLAQLQLSRVPVMMRLEQDDEDGNVITYEGETIVASSEQSGEYSSVSTWSADFQGSGPLVISNTGTTGESEVFSFQYEATGGETSISLPELIGAELLDIAWNFDLIIRQHPAAYGTSEVQFRSDTGTIAFGTALTPEAKISGIYKKEL